MKKWVDNGGTVEFVQGGTKYTSKDGVSVLYRNDKYPDFKGAGAVAEEVEIKGMIGDHVKDYDKARECFEQRG